MKLVGLVTLIAAFGVLAQPSDILIYADVELGYGTAVTTACGNLWPSANVHSYSGGTAGQTAFNTDLGAGGWDIVVIESWYYDSDYLNFMGINDIFDTTPCFVACWEWGGGTSGQMTLANNMGVSAVTTISGSPIPHYAWDPTHPICVGISDWSWNNPGLGILNNRFTVSTATPVTGWTSTSSSGQAGICCVAGCTSVISGFTPAYANQAVPIWENILGYMSGAPALERSTWGEIKTLFDE
jgi:hypothetical protein